MLFVPRCILCVSALTPDYTRNLNTDCPVDDKMRHLWTENGRSRHFLLRTMMMMGVHT